MPEQRVSFNYRVEVGLEKTGEFSSFIDAVRNLFDSVMDRMENHGMALQVLETACFIVLQEAAVDPTNSSDFQNDTTEFPLGFYDSRDLAYDMNLVTAKASILETKPSDYDEETIAQEFKTRSKAATEAYVDELVSDILDQFAQLDSRK